MQLTDSNKPTIAFIALLIGVFAISLAATFVKFSHYELSSYAIASNRLLISAIVFGLCNGGITAFQHFSPKETVESELYTAKTLGMLAIAGVLWLAALAAVFWAQSQTSIAIATLLHNLAPIFTSLGAWWFFGKTFERKFVVGMMIAIVGVGAIGWQEIQIDASRVQGDFAALLSAVFLSGYLMIMEQIRTQLSAVTMQMWICSIGAFVSLPVLLLTQSPAFPHSFNTWLMILALACICQGLGHGLLTFSLDTLSSVVVALVHLLEPVFAGMLAWIIFSEKLGFSSWVGFAIVLLGLYVAIVSQTTNDILEIELEEPAQS
ncbi:DMT family transporter [Kamptonema sp. UHCC 0994]|uniref:DMT family transporter n=1 Tax=Kamptonema sp. UHCC 0994 TaxID=3031329 RepID=UPI0023B8D401|nr:DMT family transporter [Kamptonema sp. UHCC 0994]MDF0551846.1 DMT family transporter [Kamptonema sp. UHCC 0994]